MLHIGFLLNPLAGLGGQLALKGSDGEQVRELARREGCGDRAAERARRALAPLQETTLNLHFSTWGGAMGGALLASMGIPAEVLGQPAGDLPDAGDTRGAARALREAGIDVLVFVGGDGTARDVFDAVGDNFPVLGIPAGVKMHSGVFAVSPEAAGEFLLALARGSLVGLSRREVRDIDEEAFRHDRVKSRFYGEMLVPGEGRYLQHTKVGGRESPVLVAADIAAWVVENMQPGRLYLVGPGSTTAAIMEELHLPNTLLGVDVVRDGELVAADADEQTLLALLRDPGQEAEIIVTIIGGQGMVFGRGNQQMSPAVIRRVGLDHLTIVAAKSKIAALEGRPLLVDSNDPELDRALIGYRTLLTGYDDRILYRIGRA